MRLKLVAAALSFAVLSAAPARAVPITDEFSGTTNGTSVPWAGDFYVDMGIDHLTPFTGQFVLESDTVPYYQDGTQKNYFDQMLSFTVAFGATGGNASFSGPQGLQVPPPWGWNSSSLGIGNDVPGGGGALFDQWSLYGSLAEPTGTPANVYYRFELWGTSSAPLWDVMPELDALPGTDVFGTMGFNLWATLYDDNGGWIGETRLSSHVTELNRVATAVPEPGTWVLMAIGLGGLILVRRRPTAASRAS